MQRLTESPGSMSSDFYAKLNLKPLESKQVLLSKLFKSVESMDVDIEQDTRFRKGYFHCVDDVINLLRSTATEEGVKLEE